MVDGLCGELRLVVEEVEGRGSNGGGGGGGGGGGVWVCLLL